MGQGKGQKKQQQQQAPAEDKKKAEAKEDGEIIVVMKMDVDCEGCARKVRKLARRFPGVQAATVDVGANKVTAVGKVDPKGLCEYLEKKSQKTVQLVSPQPKKDEGQGEKKKEQPPPSDKDKDKEKDKDKDKDKKPKEPPVVTTVLRVFLHCDGCARTVLKAILKAQGVESAEVDIKNHKITVKGTMEPAKLVDYLHRKTSKHVEILPPPQPKKEGDKKDGGGEKKDGGKKDGEKGNNDASAKKDKKDESKKGGTPSAGGDNNKKSGGEEQGSEAKRSEIPQPYYIIQQVPAPQLFSDENPNACSVM